MSKLSNLSKGAQETAMGNTLMSKCIAVFVALSLVLFQVPMTSAFAEDSDQAGTPAAEQSQSTGSSQADKADNEASESAATADDSADKGEAAEPAAADEGATAPAEQGSESAASESSSATAVDEPASAPAKKSARAKARTSGKVTVTSAAELKEAAANADVTEIVLGSDIVIDEAITIDHEVTITGATLSRSDRTKSIFVVTAKGDLTLKGIALADNGADGNTSKYASAIVTSGTLNLNEGAVIDGFKAADGGAVYAQSGSSVNIAGATLSNNMACGTSHAAMGGAVYAESDSTIDMKSGTVDGNTACSANSPDNRNGGMGGGFCLARGASMTMKGGTISNNTAGYYSSDQWVTARNGAGGGVFVNTKAGFVMNNGTVSGNKALSGTSGVNYYGGGGICIWNSGGYDFSGMAEVKAGAITGNEATLVGGGLYVHNYRLLPMHNAAVVTNSATIHGGGLYLCMVGEVYNFATDGTIFTNNAAAASDYDAQGDDIWSDEPWYGSKANFHLPERTESGEPITWYEDTRENPYTDASQPIKDFTNWFESNKDNNNIGLRCDAPYNTANYALIVSGNKAQEGGGIGCNGILEMCNPEKDDVPLTVKKVWDDGAEADSHAEVIIDVFNGEKKIDTVKLNKDNEWKATLTGLPADGTYTVAEEEVEGFVATVEKTSETAWEFVVTNKPDKKPVTFAKTDVAGSEIAGAKLALLNEDGEAVKDADGNTIAWTSEADKTKTIDLKPGTYTLTEVTPPTGYQVAQNITFTLASDGKITIKDADNNDVEVQTVTMEDKYAEAFVDKDFTKYLYATDMNQTFSFTMAECDAQGNVGQVSEAVKYERADLSKTTVSADDPITVTVKNSKNYTDNASTIDFPQLRYTKAGTHFYRVSEDGASASGNVAMDDSWFLLCVEVTEDATTGALKAEVKSQTLNYDGESYDAAEDELAFYNNETMTMSCMSMDYGFASYEGQELVVKPAISKELNGRVMTEGEFTFKMTETTEGCANPATYTAKNDAQGNVTFDPISFKESGDYTFEITEVAGNDPTVAYSDQVITMTVKVTYDENGALQGEPVYSENGKKIDVATFVNTATKPIIRVQKTSRDGSGDPLAGARYGLWMKNTGGADVYMGSELSDKDGYVTFSNVDIKVGETYYFKEVSAPAGHTVDEYASQLFKVVQTANGYELKYEGDEDFDKTGNSLTTFAEGEDGAGSDAKATGNNEPAKTTVLTYEKDGKGVQDEVVKLEVSKFDKATHEYVKDAEFQIIEKATGKKVATWKSGTDAKMLERQLNVDTPYILREAKAPEGYAKAADTEFTIGEYGDLKIIKGEDAKSTGKYSLEVYDTRLPVEKNVTNEVVDKTTRVTNPPATTVTQVIGKTGDNAPLAALIAVLACAGVAVIVAAANRRRQH